MNSFVAEMIRQINIARQNPKSLIPDIQNGKFSNTDKQDAISFLSSTIPCTNTVIGNMYLDALAQGYVTQQGQAGTIGHGDFLARTTDIGTYRSISENLAYGQTVRYNGQPIPQGYFLINGYDNNVLIPFLISPRDVVIALIVDEGVPNRGHRKNIYDCGVTQVGVGIAPHRTYRLEVGQLFARDFVAY
jgi:uncharacterized protein YkwD